MEKQSGKSLPQIFKFSNLWNILPFYGSLIKWKALLSCLNSKTNKIWNKYEYAFLKWGQNCRDEKNIKSNNPGYLDIEDISNLHMFYKCFYVPKKSLERIYKDVRLSKDMMLLIDKSEKEDFDYKINIVNRDSISDYVPAINCPNYKEDFQLFDVSTDLESLIRFIKDEVETRAIVVSRIGEQVKVEKIISPLLRFFEKEYDIQLELYNKCPLKIWFWKPNAMITPFLNENNISRELIKICKFPSIKEMKINPKIDDSVIDSSDEDYDFDSHEGNDNIICNDFFKMIQKYQFLKLCYPKISIYKYYELGNMLKINTRSIIFIHNEIIAPIKCNYSTFRITGHMKGIIDIEGVEYLMLDLNRLSAYNINLQYDSRSDVLKDIYSQKLTECKDDNSSLRILFRIEDIQEIDWGTLRNLWLFENSKMLEKVQILQDWDRYKPYILLNDLKSIPNNSKLELRGCCQLMSSTFNKTIGELWNKILEFSNISLRTKSGAIISKIEIVGEYNIEDITKNKFRIMINKVEEEMSYNILWFVLNNRFYYN